MGGFYSIPNYNNNNFTSKSGLGSGIANQYGINQGLEGQQQNQRGSEFGSALPGYQSLLNSGYSPAEKSAISQGTTGAISSSYSDAATGAGRHTAATNNSAGFGSTLDSLARNKGKDVAQQQGANEVNFANQAYQRKLAGLQGISQMYGIDSSFLNSLGNQQLGVLGIGNSVQSRSRGVLGTIGAGLGLVGL